MPSGDAQRTWFPEMVARLRSDWHGGMVDACPSSAFETSLTKCSDAFEPAGTSGHR